MSEFKIQIILNNQWTIKNCARLFINQNLEIKIIKNNKTHHQYLLMEEEKLAKIVKILQSAPLKRTNEDVNLLQELT